MKVATVFRTLHTPVPAKIEASGVCAPPARWATSTSEATR